MTIVLALSDGKFSALVAAIASVSNTLLILTVRSNIKRTREHNKEATRELIDEVKSRKDDEDC